jgi:hypothetical protein
MTTNITSQFHIPRGLGFAPLNVRIYRRTTKKLSPQGLQIGPQMSELVKGFSKTFGLGLTLTPSNVRIYRRVLLQTIKYRKFHLPGFTNWGLKFGISERIKIFSDPWLTFTPPHFRISERNFKKCLDFRGCKCPDIWKDFSSHLHLDN